MDNVKKTIWVVVDENLEFTEFDSKEQALSKNAALIFCERTGTWSNIGYTNFAYDVQFYNKAGETIDGIAVNKWSLTGPNIHPNSNWSRTTIHFTVMDPLGNYQDRKFGESRVGIKSALGFIQEVSKYSSWEEYKKHTEAPPKHQDSNIQELEQQIQRLKTENLQLKEKLETISRILQE